VTPLAPTPREPRKCNVIPKYEAAQVLCLWLAVALASIAQPASAWVYPEHRDIAILAVDGLNPEQRAKFDRLWAYARTGREARLCAESADVGQSLKPGCIDWPAMNALSGDHSCSSSEMFDTVVSSEWVLTVARVGAQLKADLAAIGTLDRKTGRASPMTLEKLRQQFEDGRLHAKRMNALRASDMHLQRVDTEYATRAGANNAHFLLARPRPDFSTNEYVLLTLEKGAEINAIGVWEWYHLSALQKATRLAHEQLTSEEYSAVARSALADEAFASHFLEDAYAAGHVPGTWGDVSRRKGTHDYYNQSGLEVSTWQGGSKTVVLMGDAHMRLEDAERAAATVRLSLEQFIDTASGPAGKTDLPHAPAAPAHPDTLDVCRTNQLPARPVQLLAPAEALRLIVEIVQRTPMPGLAEGLGALPRFRSEVGPFISVGALVDVRRLGGGFTEAQRSGGFIAGADLSVRIGYGLEGVLDEAGDGLIFLGLGIRGDSPSSSKYSDTSSGQQNGELTAAIPARTGYTARIRLPFYVVPGDLLLAAPLHFLSEKTYQKMAVTAANGGLIPWQLAWGTRLGRFQLVLGREIGLSFYGLRSADTLPGPSVPPGAGPSLAKFKSTFIDAPILEFRPYRAFDTSQAAEFKLQLFFGIDIPRGGQVSYPLGTPNASLRSTYSLGICASFDWRHYH
jgi:hypothetical protein